MADQFSSAAALKLDNATGALTDISNSVTNVETSGGNELQEVTGLGEGVRREASGLSPVNSMTLTFKVNSTTSPIFAPLVNGTSVTKTVELKLLAGTFLTGEANVGTVSFSTPIGLQTGTAELRSSDPTGFNRTSVGAA